MNKSEKFCNNAAERYAKSPISDATIYDKKLSEALSFFSPDMGILEFGCGTGTTAIRHAPHMQHVEALDTSANMIKIGRDKARENAIKNIRFTHGTLAAFNAGGTSLDAVLGLNVIHLLPDRQVVIAEVARILKPSGIFVSGTACPGHSYLRCIKLVAPLGKLLGLMPDVYVLTEAELANEITSAGFGIEHQ